MFGVFSYLYTIEGAITDINFNKLSGETKKDLNEFSDEWKEQIKITIEKANNL